MKFKRLVSALSMGTALSAISLGALACAEVEDPQTTIDGFNEQQAYDQKRRVHFTNGVDTYVMAKNGTMTIPLEREPGDVTYKFYSNNTGAVQVAEDTGFCVAVGVGNATISIKGSDDTFGEYYIESKESIEIVEDTTGRVQATSTDKQPPSEIRVENCADEVSIARNQKLEIRFRFDQRWTEMTEPTLYTFSYDFVRNSVIDTNAGWQVGGQGSFTFSGNYHEILTINSGKEVLVPGDYTLNAYSYGGLSKQIIVHVLDKYDIAEVKVVDPETGSMGNIMTFRGFQTKSFVPVFYPNVAGLVYEATSLNTDIFTVKSAESGGRSIIQTCGVGTGICKLQVTDGDNTFTRSFAVCVSEVFISGFGGFKFGSIYSGKINSGVDPNRVILRDDETDFQAYVLPENATEASFDGDGKKSSIGWTVSCPNSNGGKRSSANAWREVSIAFNPAIGVAYAQQVDESKGSSFKGGTDFEKSVLRGACQCYQSGLITGNLKIERTGAAGSDSEKSKHVVMGGYALFIGPMSQLGAENGSVEELPLDENTDGKSNTSVFDSIYDGGALKHGISAIPFAVSSNKSKDKKTDMPLYPTTSNRVSTRSDKPLDRNGNLLEFASYPVYFIQSRINEDGVPMDIFQSPNTDEYSPDELQEVLYIRSTKDTTTNSSDSRAEYYKGDVSSQYQYEALTYYAPARYITKIVMRAGTFKDLYATREETTKDSDGKETKTTKTVKAFDFDDSWRYYNLTTQGFGVPDASQQYCTWVMIQQLS